jgi:hypothetical protein
MSLVVVASALPFGGGCSFRRHRRALLDHRQPARRQPARRLVRRELGDAPRVAIALSRDRGLLLGIALVLVIGHDMAGL